MVNHCKMEKTSIELLREQFERNNNACNSVLLCFKGVGERTVYNCSIPLEYEGDTYIFGRVEEKKYWGNSHSVLFNRAADGVFYPDARFLAFNLEDPFWEYINGEYILGGNLVFREPNDLHYRTMFFRSKDLFSWYHFAVGPDMMKDIRLVQLPEGKVGVFSRPRSQAIKDLYGSESMIGFTIINSIDELTVEVIEKAPYIPNFFQKDEWGGVNQAIYLGDDKIGIVGHQCYSNIGIGIEEPCYLNMAYVYDIKESRVIERKIIGSRKSYPECESKIPGLYDCAFTSGIVFREDGLVDLYSGLGDMFEGVKTIQNPFANYMK